MSAVPVAILRTGLVTSVGLSAPAACAAIRAGVANPTETLFIDSAGEWIMAHQVPLERPWRGLARLVEMGTLAIEECLAAVPREDWPRIPLLLCIAEAQRPGRLAGLDAELFAQLQRRLNVEFAQGSLIIAHGRVSVAIALREARDLIVNKGVPRALIAGVDSLLTAPTLRAYERDERLLTPANANGFMPGEGAGAILVGPATQGPQLLCAGLGFGTEPAPIDSEEPLRGDGLVRAIKAALGEAGCELHHLDFRITDLSGEQYYFKEAALALSRVLRARKSEFELWHPGEYVGETGAASGLASLVVAEAACRKDYARGPNILWHSALDNGYRAAAVLQAST
jgi:3-oxoacyl-[acyl-carrier-protein] synthase-1